MSDVPNGSRNACDDVSALLAVSLELAESLELDAVFQAAIRGAIAVFGFGTGAIYQVRGDELYLGATTPAIPADFPQALRRDALAEHPHIASALASRTPVHVPDVTTEPFTPAEQMAVEGRSLKSALYVPVVARGVAEAVLIVGTQDARHEYTDREVDLCRTLSSEIGYAIANARLYETVESAARELRDAYDATLEGWAKALEMRDEETCGHTERAAELAVDLARSLGMDGSALLHVRRGALLHDIGKMAVPDAILRKPGPLSEDEWTVMRKHPEFAREFLADIGYLEPALEIPYSHHERWDGTGYPRGLSGEAIPLAARIFAVIDVYDALTSDRPYRPAWAPSEAIAHIQIQAGVHFDPAVVDVFVDRMRPAEH